MNDSLLKIKSKFSSRDLKTNKHENNVFWASVLHGNEIESSVCYLNDVSLLKIGILRQTNFVWENEKRFVFIFCWVIIIITILSNE